MLTYSSGLSTWTFRKRRVIGQYALFNVAAVMAHTAGDSSVCQKLASRLSRLEGERVKAASGTRSIASAIKTQTTKVAHEPLLLLLFKDTNVAL